jgi:hypothetical protein
MVERAHLIRCPLQRETAEPPAAVDVAVVVTDDGDEATDNRQLTNVGADAGPEVVPDGVTAGRTGGAYAGVGGKPMLLKDNGQDGRCDPSSNH